MPRNTSVRTLSAHPRRSARRRLSTRLTGIALAASVTVLGPAAPALAHDQLLSSEPAEAAELIASPTEITLEFSNDVLTVGAVILLVDQDGRDWIAGETELDGPVVSAPIDGELPDGVYEARWRVVSSDGHPISGIVPFTVGDASNAKDRAGTAETTAQAPEQMPEGSLEPAPEQAAAAAPESADPSNTWRTVAIGAAGAGGALLIFAAWMLLKGNRRTTSDPSA